MTTPRPHADPSAAVRTQHLALIASLPQAERLSRALALSDFVRALAWTGALRHAHGDLIAARKRFLAQQYGAHPPLSLQRLIDAL